ncbi:hypothetical protein J2S74_000830 [Evansella vedderi]|uniref:Uncharacterized protein n=1 Tax=Evansella vedderi TaxID=38282 RepID=A0ABT9ZQE5_9BACI|nr:alkaline phosphatase family protein [Evansella vedderi]MDQ0253458.1 hypothetical protein [Evansella vedderi]
MTPSSKPIVLLIIDTLMTRPLEEAIQNGYAPALKFFKEKGNYFPQMVSSFPTMSVTIESTLLTGEYSHKHRLPALIWYHEDEQRIVNYGTGIKEIMKTGFSQFVKDMYYGLNNVHLSRDVKTIHEELGKRSLKSAAINAFVYRGKHIHEMKLPPALRLTTGYNSTWKIQGPPIWSLGSFSKLSPFTVNPQIFSGNYKAGFRELKHLIRKNKLPPFTMCVIQDLDLRIHFKGPMDMKGIQKIDRELQKMLNLYGSWDNALQEATWIILSDNGHAPMGDRKDHHVIHLRKVLDGFTIMKGTTPISPKDELALAVNQRMAFIYCIGPNVNKNKVIEQLRGDERIDIIAWEEEGKNHVVSGVLEGKLSFWPGEDYVDEYKQTWGISGEVTLLDITIRDNQITYGNYPDALARLSSSLQSHQGNYLVVTAKPGYEFKEKASPIHVGGAAHGSLHKYESLVPMIVAGTDSYPKKERIVDLKEWILSLI